MSKAPKLRFKEFSGDWKEKKLGDLLIKSTETTNENSDIPVLTSSRKGLFLQSEYFKKEIAAKDTTGYNILRRGYFTYRHMSDDSTFFFNINNILDLALVSPEYPVFTTNDSLNSYILQQHLNNSPLFYNFCKKQKKGGTRTRLYFSVLQEYKLAIPSKEEQDKMASFFSLIDNKISLQGEKVEALKDYKRGMMQKIFSRELRFKDDEGRDYPEWEEKKLGDLFNIKAGGDIKSDNVSKEMTEKNIYPVYANALTNKGLYGYTDTFKIEGDTITVTGRGDIGYAIARSEKYYPIVRLLALSPLVKLNIIYFENIINFTKIFVESTGVPQLTSPQLSQVKVKVPVFEEQEKIANILKNIDNKIDKEQEKLDSLNEYKKGLLQQMFV